MRNRDCIRLALRFLHSRSYGALARFISMASTTGICVGVCMIIIGLSAMNGFEYELNNRVLSLIPAGELNSGSEQGFKDLDTVLSSLEENKHITAASPAVTLSGAFSAKTSYVPAAIVGIDPALEKKVIAIDRFMDCPISALSDKNNSAPPVIVGQGILNKLNLKAGDLVSLSAISTQKNNNGLSTLESQQFRIAGTFKTGGQLDGNLAFINIETAMKLMDLESPNSDHVSVDNMLNASMIVYEASLKLTEPNEEKSWIDSQGKLYSDINMIRGIMYLAMILIIAVACFNIVSNLIMAVSEKSREIAILITLGMKKSSIVKVFTMMGLFNGMRGCVYGGVAGVAIALATPYVTSHFKEWFGIQLLNENIYFINYVPSVISLSDIALVFACALAMSLAASFYPAYKATRITPVQELNQAD